PEEAKAEFEKVSRKLEEERKIFKADINKIKTRRAILDQKTLNFEKRKKDFEEHFSDNKRKMENAARKIQLEKNQINIVQNEINNLKKEYKRLQAVKLEQERSLRYFTQFHNFLYSALQYCEEFGEINELISRAEALKSLLFELKARELESSKIIQKIRKSAQLTQLTKTEHLLENFNNLVA
ncbi:unnamed protein product, partial [Hymenolepis diminuta]